MKRVFTGREFAGYYAAVDWLEEQGYSYGSMQGGAPIGVLRRTGVCIAKWRNLTAAERAELDGVLEGEKHDGPVTITMYDDEDRRPA